MSAGDIEGFAIDPGKVRKWKRYPAYKDSRVEWLGGVPAGWEMSSIKRHFGVQLGKMLQNEANGPGDKLMPYLRAANISWEKILVDDVKEMWFSESEKAQYRIEKGDLLVSEGGDVGRAALWIGELDECYIQNAINRIRSSDGALTSHLYYWMYFLKHVDYIDMLCNKATIAHYTAEKVMNTVYLRPPLPEQHAIAAFLDRETARIDALIAKKQRFIELLEEKRQAIISHAVTKGLDPNVEMKDSGVAWIGEVPKHWQLTRLKFLSTLQTGLTLGKKYSEDQPLVIRPYLRVANVQEGYFDLNTITEIRIPPEDVTRYELQPDDVLMTEGGDYDKLGRGSVWEGQIPGCLHQNHIFAVRPSPSKLKSRFLAAVIASSHGKNYFTSTSQQTTNLATTNSTKLQSLPVPVPPIVEQEEIVAFIQNMNNTTRELISKVESSIEKLHEFRTALISAAVTGKIDVRGEAPAAP